MKVRIKFRKYGAMKFIGHLDVMRYFQKAMRRAEIPIAFTAGYSPHMIMSFANPLGVGLTSDGEYFDIELSEEITSEKAVEALNSVMVEGIDIVSFVSLSEEQKSGMSIVAAADYLCTPIGWDLPSDLEAQLAGFMAQDDILIVKKTKKSTREVDIKPMIYDLKPMDQGIFMKLATGSVENLKPGLVMEAIGQFLELEEAKHQSHRMEVYANVGDEENRTLVSLESLGEEIK